MARVNAQGAIQDNATLATGTLSAFTLSGSNRLLYISVPRRSTQVSTITVGGITIYELGVNETRRVFQSTLSGIGRLEVFRVFGADLPANGNHDIVVTNAAAGRFIIQAIQYDNADQTTGHRGTPVTVNESSATSMSLAITADSGDQEGIAFFQNSDTTGLTPTSPTTTVTPPGIQLMAAGDAGIMFARAAGGQPIAATWTNPGSNFNAWGASILAVPATVVIAEVARVNEPANQATAVTNSFSTVDGRVYVVVAGYRHGTNRAPTSAIFSGSGLTLDQRANFDQSSNLEYVVYSGLASSNSSGTITQTWSGNVTNQHIYVFELSGNIDLGGSNGANAITNFVRQIATPAAASIIVTLPGVTAGNGIIACAMTESAVRDFVTEAGWTAGTEVDSTENTVVSMWRLNTSDSTAQFDLVSGTEIMQAIGFEVVAEAAGIVVTPDATPDLVLDVEIPVIKLGIVRTPEAVPDLDLDIGDLTVITNQGIVVVPTQSIDLVLAVDSTSVVMAPPAPTELALEVGGLGTGFAPSPLAVPDLQLGVGSLQARLASDIGKAGLTIVDDLITVTSVT